MKSAVKIHVQGLVQGVGFRPFIYNLAHRFGIKGWVENRNDGVFIHAEESNQIISQFLDSIESEAPIASNIYSINVIKSDFKKFIDFKIVKSENKSNEITEVSPDIAVCENCLSDLKIQEHRIAYPFINCTNCGPRFTIIKDLPYDRDKTTMHEFVMCETCQKEYIDIRDRRFHAQPVACNNCGPLYSIKNEKKLISDFDDVLNSLINVLENEGIAAIKGLGGYHLACDAKSEKAVNRLRKSKKREGKPFAVLCSSLEKIKEFAFVGEVEEKQLLSWQRPIVLLKLKNELASGVCNGLDKVGVMLPYMPFHHLLFEKTKLDVLVLTSGNLSDEPIVIDNQKAESDLLPICDVLVTYNRDIYNRTDDSVCFVANNKNRILRRSRGFVPSPIRTNLNTEGIFAAGAELVNCFCFGKDNQAILSQHIGDLKNPETLEFYSESFERFKKLFRVSPELIVHDMHPDYLSTKFAKELGIKTIEVQHHHAHIASCMAEHGLDEKVIGVSFDGTGLGDDGNIWGGEFLIADLAEYERINHFEYTPMPGGDKVTKQPWRMALSYLYHYFGKVENWIGLPFLSNIKQEEINIIIQAIDLKINAPLTSSSGRLFDAVSALLNICPVSLFHAEAPMRLEASMQNEFEDFYPFEISKSISFKTMFEEILQDLQNKIPVGEISTKFHNTLVEIIAAVAIVARHQTKINKIVLSGGTFQNQYLLEKVENKLENYKFEVFSQQQIPSNDGGIALGQLAIAAKRRALGVV
jgi:hydrogenase maturation protein HypF